MTQAVFSFLKEHDKLCTWDGLTIAVSKMLCLKNSLKWGRMTMGLWVVCFTGFTYHNSFQALTCTLGAGGRQ